MIKYGYKGLNKIRNKIQSKELKEKGRKNLKDFTRKRKMDFERLIHYIGLSTLFWTIFIRTLFYIQLVLNNPKNYVF